MTKNNRRQEDRSDQNKDQTGKNEGRCRQILHAEGRTDITAAGNSLTNTFNCFNNAYQITLITLLKRFSHVIQVLLCLSNVASNVLCISSLTESHVNEPPFVVIASLEDVLDENLSSLSTEDIHVDDVLFD